MVKNKVLNIKHIIGINISSKINYGCRVNKLNKMSTKNENII